VTPEVRRALAYPFDPPTRSYVFAAGRAVEESDAGFRDALARALSAPRTAVIASGSNASPARLMEKFGRDAVIPTLRAELADHAVVHSAKFTRYGAMPATLHPHPGARARVFVNLLDEAQLARMDETEDLGGEYDRVEAAAPDPLSHGVEIDRFEAYISRFGALRAGEGAAASAAADQDAPGLSVLTQRDAIAHAMGVLEQSGELHDFVARVIADHDFRARSNAQLKATAGLPFAMARA